MVGSGTHRLSQGSSTQVNASLRIVDAAGDTLYVGSLNLELESDHSVIGGMSINNQAAGLAGSWGPCTSPAVIWIQAQGSSLGFARISFFLILSRGHLGGNVSLTPADAGRREAFVLGSLEPDGTSN